MAHWLEAEHQQIVAEFERAIGIEPDDLDAEGGEDDRQGARGGDPHDHTEPDTTIDGTGPGGHQTRAVYSGR